MVQVDVFYKTLANKTLVQQKAYTYPMLLGKCIIFKFQLHSLIVVIQEVPCFTY